MTPNTLSAVPSLYPLSEETPADILRNALQVIAMAARTTQNGRYLNASETWHLTTRLTRALELVERRIP